MEERRAATHGRLTRDEFVERVRINLNEYLERHRDVELQFVAVDLDYSYTNLKKFRSGERKSLPLAMALITKFPALGQGIVCTCCGSPPLLSFRES